MFQLSIVCVFLLLVLCLRMNKDEGKHLYFNQYDLVTSIYIYTLTVGSQYPIIYILFYF